MVTIDDVEKSSFRFLAILKEAKPHCSTLHTRLSRAAHVDVNTVEPNLSDTDVRDRSRIRTEKQDTEKHNVRQGCRTKTSPDRKTPLSGSHLKHRISRRPRQDSSPRLNTTKDTSLPVTSWEMLCLQGPRPRATGPPGSGEGARHPFREWSTADIAGDDKDADSEGLSKDSSAFQDTTCTCAAGRHGEEGHTQPTGTVPRHHVMSSVRNSICTLAPW